MLSIMIAMALLADAAAPPVEKVKATRDETMICKTEKVLGSKIKQRVCMAAWQWEERRADDSEMLNKGQRQQPMAF